MSTEILLSKILSAPVGKVVDVLCEILNSNIELKIIEQVSRSPNEFDRKVVISSNNFPIINAHTKFDSAVIPKGILDELLKKNQGIGAILSKNNIKATRKEISLTHDSIKNIVSRKYEIIYDESVWFTIFEMINLGSFNTNKNSRRTPS